MFAIGIVAHVKRADQAQTLAQQVQADYIHIDDGTLGCENNHRHVWQWMVDNNTQPWGVVLEDDALPVEGFRQQLEQALTVAPAPVVSLYLGRLRPCHWQAPINIATREAKAIDASWLTTTHLLHAVAVAIRTHLLPSLLGSYRTALAIDEHISNWTRQHQHPVAYTWPSLVNHADGPTLVRHPDQDRRLPGRTAWAVGQRPRWTTTSTPSKAPPP